MAKGRNKKTPPKASRRREPPPKRTTTQPPAAVRARAASDEQPADTAPRRASTVVAGVGASAGGLEAFSALLGALPDDPGLALVLVQHLAPHYESALPTLLSGTTKLPVVQAADGMRVQANRVYVVPPNVQIAIR